MQNFNYASKGLLQRIANNKINKKFKAAICKTSNQKIHDLGIVNKYFLVQGIHKNPNDNSGKSGKTEFQLIEMQIKFLTKNWHGKGC